MSRLIAEVCLSSCTQIRPVNIRAKLFTEHDAIARLFKSRTAFCRYPALVYPFVDRDWINFKERRDSSDATSVFDCFFHWIQIIFWFHIGPIEVIP